MEEYVIKPDLGNANDSLFIWYLVFARMSQNFSAILDIISPYLPHASEPSDVQKSRTTDRVYIFIIKIAFGYICEAQKTIRNFISTSVYDDFQKIIPDDHEEYFALLHDQWNNNYKNGEYKYLSELRNSVFHFASSDKDIEDIKAGYIDAVNEILVNLSFEMKIRESKIDEREIREDSFVDLLWMLNLDKGYSKIDNHTTIENETYAKDVSSIIINSLDLCYNFIFPVRDLLEQYYIHKGIITKVSKQED